MNVTIKKNLKEIQKRKLLCTAITAVVTLSMLTACNSGTDVSTTEVDQNPAPVTSSVDLLEAEAVAGAKAGAQGNQPVTVLQDAEARPRLEEFVANVEIAGSSRSAVHRAGNITDIRHYVPPVNRENYATLDDNGIKRVAEVPVSTFSIDVDTASYSNIRRYLNLGQLPPEEAVRTEELVNYFAYQYPLVGESDEPFAIHTEVSASPWSTGKHLLHIGLQAVDPEQIAEPAANLVFLVDVSGSMNSPDKLRLLKTSLKMLARQLDAEDSVALVVYAGASGVVLAPTKGDQDRKIIAALEQLRAGGSTNGAAGIELAYQLAQDAYIDGGINRVILATDGDFNVGTVSVDALKDLITEKRKTGISLTTLGFGTGNINDHLMEQLADNGNGNYAYIDNLNEARKVLVDEMSSTLQTVAKDVKIQIEFNPAVVAEYRLVGYENRVLNREDFNNDKIDAGEIGAGHTVTALYEISLANGDTVSVDPLRYTGNQEPDETTLVDAAELGFLRLRYKQPDGDSSTLIEHPLLAGDIVESIDETSADYRFSAAVAGFAQILRRNTSVGSFTYDDVLSLALPAKGDDEFGYRAEFINLVKTASALN